MEANKYYGVFTISFAKFMTKKRPPYPSQLWYSVSRYPMKVYPAFYTSSTFFYMNKFTSKKLRSPYLRRVGIDEVTCLGNNIYGQ